MTTQEGIIKRMQDYQSKKHQQIPEWWAEIELPILMKYPYYTLRDILNNSKDLHLSHNGFIDIGLPFEEVISFFNLHPSPKDIKEETYSSTSIKERVLHGLDENLNITNEMRGAVARFIDANPDYRGSIYHRVIEDIFGLKNGSFKCEFVQGGYGIRLDKDGPFNKFFEKILGESIPLFVRTADLGKNSSNSAYIINGFDI